MEGQSPDSLSLKSHIVAGLPIVNHFLDKLGIDRLLATVHPTLDMRSNVSDGQALGVLLWNIIRRESHGDVCSATPDGPHQLFRCEWEFAQFECVCSPRREVAVQVAQQEKPNPISDVESIWAAA